MPEDVNPERPALQGIINKRERTATILSQREALVGSPGKPEEGKIGKGVIRSTNSLEEAIRVGRTRERVRGTIERFRERVTDLDHQIEESAEEYLIRLEDKKGQITELDKLVESGNLTADEVTPWQEEYNDLAALPKISPALQRGIDEVLRKRELGQPVTSATILEEVSAMPEVREKKEPALIPPIPELHYVMTYHMHRYDQSITVRSKADGALKIDEGERTAEQKQLLEDIATLERFHTSENYRDVYTPEELHGLAEKLTKLEHQDKGAWDEVERHVIDWLYKTGHLSEKEADEYAEDKEKRSRSIRMKWGPQMATIFIDRGNKWGPQTADYLVSVEDPVKNGHSNNTALYQFAAHDYALTVLGARADHVVDFQKEAFVENCQTIDEWYEQARSFIDQLPDDIKLVTKTLGEKGRSHYREVTARHQIKELIDTMHQRLNGQATWGFNKNYKLDPAGAISLQKRIAYAVSKTNEMLLGEEKAAVEEIVPLEQ